MSSVQADIDLSICIVNWNTKDFLEKCLLSIERHTKGIRFEIIVVDNESGDGSREMILEQPPTHIVTILNDSNVGFAKANNQGLRIACGRYLVFLNPDTELLEDSFTRMVRFLDENPRYGAIGCRLLNVDGTTQLTCSRDFPTLWNQFCYFSLLSRMLSGTRLFCSEDLEYWDRVDSSDVNVVSGACLMASREILLETGGFDESTFMYAEDVDLCRNIIKKGKKIRFDSGTAILHYGGVSSNQIDNPYSVSVMLRSGHEHYFRKHHGLFHAFTYRGIVFIGMIIRLFASIIALIYFRVRERKRTIYIRQVIRRDIRVLFWSLCLSDAGQSSVSRQKGPLEPST